MEITIEITKYCPNTCEYCSTKASEDGKHLLRENIINFLQDQSDITRINISGGEPLAHPDFYQILMYCYTLCDDVRVYTNAIKHIMFNADVLKKVTVSANVCIMPGADNFIPDVENIHLLRPVKQGNLEKDFINKITLSHDCKTCGGCKHILLQADGRVVASPCKKDY